MACDPFAGLLEVNLSPALSHSSGHQSAMISSMCEGLLRLTVDRIFPPPKSAANNGVDSESFDSDASEGVGAPGAASNGEVGIKPSQSRGRWRLVTRPHPGVERKQTETLSSPSDVAGRPRNPGAQVFSLRGRHLTRRSLARAERGVREASAVNVLAVWWKSTAEERREKRQRKRRAIAKICSWVSKVVARRRRRALRGTFERAATVIQARWRREAEDRRAAARMAACVVVQAAWRHRQLKRRCHYRLVRHHVFSGLQSWARSVLSEKKTKAGKTVLRAVVAVTTRKRRAAAVVARGVRTACNRRRKSRLRLQRFARMPCLLHIRLTALRMAKLGRSRSRAAEIIVRALRQATTRSAAAARASCALQKLQFWCRSVLQRQKQRSASSEIIQKAWRRARERRGWATAGLRCRTDLSAHHSLAVADEPLRKGKVDTVAAEMSTTTNVGMCAIVPRKLPLGGHHLNIDSLGSALLDISGNPDRSKSPHRAKDESIDHGVPISMDDTKRGTSLVSPATTMREEWTDHDLGLADGDVRSRSSHISGSLSYIEEQHRERAASMRSSSPYHGETPSTASVCEQQEKTGPTDKVAEGILDLEDILPDLRKRRQRVVSSGGGCWPKELKGVRNKTSSVDRCRKVGAGTAGGRQPAYTRSPWEERKRSRMQGGHSGAVVGRRNPKASTAWKRTPVMSAPPETADSHSRAGPWGSRRLRDSSSKPRSCGDGTRWKGESGGVLEMLAFLEA